MTHKKGLIKTYFDGECFQVYSQKINIKGLGLTKNIHGFGLTREDAKKDLLDFWNYVKFKYKNDTNKQKFGEDTILSDFKTLAEM